MKAYRTPDMITTLDGPLRGLRGTKYATWEHPTAFTGLLGSDAERGELRMRCMRLLLFKEPS